MDKKEEAKNYFYKHIKEIESVAREIAEKQHENIEFRMNIIKNQYLYLDGTKDKEFIVNHESIDISKYLSNIRENNYETVCFLWIENNKIVDSYLSGETTFKTSFSMEIIENKTKQNQCGFYCVHNHPFMYKANISGADGECMEKLVTLAELWEYEVIDFAVVTKFDYWSMKQQLKNV